MMKRLMRWRGPAAILLAVSMLATPAAHTAAAPAALTAAVKDGWISQDGGWYYAKNGSYVKGWQEIGGAWYYFDTSGRMQTGWQQIGGKWYYFKGSGRMVTGWQEIGGAWYYFAASGRMLTGWQEISGKWYYLASSGKMVTGWQKISGKWYYFASSGKMATGWQKVSGKWYYFASSGKMVTGWKEISEKWYYFESSGAMKTGWLQEKNYWYYLKSDGSMAVEEMAGQYYFDTKGHWVKGVAPDSELTYEHVLALLDAYDADGAFIARNAGERGTMAWISGDTMIDGLKELKSAVHEACHMYTIYSSGTIHNSYTNSTLPNEERIYLGNGKSMQVAFTEVYDSSEMEDLVPEEGRGGRFELYISPSGESSAARACGVYGLLNEFTAYCWGLANINRIEPFVDQDKVYGVSYTDYYLSWAEFRQFILAYMLYAKENYPAVYQDISENESFREAFTAIDTRFQKEVATYRANHDMYPKYETKYQALTAEMNKKEYLEMIEILKP